MHSLQTKLYRVERLFCHCREKLGGVRNNLKLTKNYKPGFFVNCSMLIAVMLVVQPLLVQKVWADTEIATVPVGDLPIQLKFSPANNNVYVANTGSNTVSVISSSNNNVIATIPVGANPSALEFSPANNATINSTSTIYVVNSGSNTVSAIDSSNDVIATIPVGVGPFAIEFNEANKNIYVANRGGSNSISVIDGFDRRVIATIPVDDIPIQLEFNEANKNIYVANFFSTISVINSANDVIATIPVGVGPEYLEFNPVNNNLYISLPLQDTVSVIATSAP